MKTNRVRNSLVLSLVLHCLFLASTFVLPELFKKETQEFIEIEITDIPSVIPKKQLEPLKQIVEQNENSLNDEIPENAQFLSQNNQVVKKQTAAAKVGEFQNKKDKKGQKGEGGLPKLSLKDLAPQYDFEKLAEQRIEREKKLEQELNEKAGSGASASQTMDYLKDIEKGNETLLSTREFVYYSFYSRIRKQLNQHWSGKVREKMTKIFKEGRSIASTEDRVTKLLITLDKQGILTKVQVVSDSGVRDLDEAAIEAFREAAPFPNPPEGIVESDGTIKIRWDFILEA